MLTQHSFYEGLTWTVSPITRREPKHKLPSLSRVTRKSWKRRRSGCGEGQPGAGTLGLQSDRVQPRAANLRRQEGRRMKGSLCARRILWPRCRRADGGGLTDTSTAMREELGAAGHAGLPKAIRPQNFNLGFDLRIRWTLPVKAGTSEWISAKGTMVCTLIKRKPVDLSIWCQWYTFVQPLNEYNWFI